jgi:hypothetical protein
VCVDESMRKLWKQFWWSFLSRHQLRFSRLFLSQQGLRALMNPFICSGSCFGNDFWVHNDSVFLDYFWVKMGCVRSWIHASSQETVLVMISESVVTQFSLTIYESTKAACADESKHQLCKQYRLWFLSTQQLSFPWLFMSQNGLCAVTNSCVIIGNSFGDDFWVGSDLVFLDYLWVNMGCVQWWIQAQHCKQFCWWFLNRYRLRFPILFLSQPGHRALMYPCVSCGSCFGDDFWVPSNSVFLDYLLVNRGWVCWRIQASALQAVSVMIFESAATQFFMNISYSIGIVCAKESMCQLWKQFRWWFISRQWLRFPWLYLNQPGLCAFTNLCVSSGSCFGDDLWVHSDSVFLDYLWVNRGCVRWWIQVSALQTVSLMIFESKCHLYK